MFHPKALAAEMIGTFWLVLGGCGAAVLAADFGTGANGTSLGIGFAGVAFAFGLTVLTGAYAVGHVSGGHFNPAVTIGLVVGGRFEPIKAIGYIIAQVIDERAVQPRQPLVLTAAHHARLRAVPRQPGVAPCHRRRGLQATRP